MTKFTDFQIGRVGAPDGSATDFVTIDSSGTSQFQGPMTVSAGITQGALTVVNAVTTAQVTADNTGGDAVPASAAAFMEVSVNGTTYMVALFTKAT